jgi:hypothetical protein
MKLRSSVAGLLAGAIVVSSAIAAPRALEGKRPATGPACKPRIAVVLKGVLAGTPGASATAISVNVQSGNRWGRAYAAALQPRSIGVDAKTKVRRQGAKTLAALVSGDRVNVQARACKADLANSATPALVASKVIAHSAKSAKDDDDKGEKDDDDD